MRIRPIFICVLTALSVGLCGTGCLSSKVVMDSRVPVLEIDDSGNVTFNEKSVKFGKIASALRSADIPRSAEIHIMVPDHPDRNAMQKVSGELIYGGYTRTVFVKKRKALSELAAPKKP